MFHSKHPRLAAIFLTVCLAFSSSTVSQATKTKAQTDKEQRIAAHQAVAIESNARTGWPAGPVVTAESAILIEATTGTILYEKNIHAHQYPASTTKILTALLAYENSSLDEIVTFSHDDVFGIPRNSNHIAMDVGDTLTMETCLNALLIRSANEVAYAIAAHVGGSWEGFAKMMNDRAKELGAVDSNFVNPNGLPNEEHVTSAYDLAMIGRAFFANDYLCKITLSPKLVVQKKNGELVEWNQMPIIPTGKYAYEYIVGCKTGYTDSAHNTLVSCAEKSGMRLICVVLNDENPQYNEDTIALFEYGFNNFNKVNVSQTETKYDIDNIGFFYDNTDIFGAAEPILSLNKEDCVVIPKTASFDDLTSSISYDTGVPGRAALITYDYHGTQVGTVSIDLTKSESNGYAFESDATPAPEETVAPAEAEKDKKDKKEVKEKKEKSSFFFIDFKKIVKILIIIGIIAVIVGIFIFLQRNFQFSFGPGLHRSRNHDYAKRDYKLSRDMQRERKAQIRAAKKRYKERLKRR